MLDYHRHYRKIHWRLTAIFSASILIIILIYSSLVLFAQRRARLQVERDFFTKTVPSGFITPAIPIHPATPALRAGLSSIEHRIQSSLWFFNFFVWFIGSVIGYFLTGFLLRPALKQAQEQQDFLDCASHELKTPITTIKTELQSLVKTKMNSDCRSSLQVIENENLILENLASKLLTFGLITNSPQLKNIDLSELISKKSLQYCKIFNHKNLVLDLEIPSKAPIISDESKLNQLLDLLLDNAYKYSHSQTIVNLSLKITSQNTYIIDVINVGLGISPTNYDKIWQKFYRVTNQAVQKQVGSGLGLAIAQDLASSLHAQISLVSGDPLATHFSIILPAVF